MSIWYAYRMNFLAKGKTKGSVYLTPCKGSAAGGGCYFDEFLHHVSPAWKGTTTIGKDLQPTLEKGVEAIVKSQYNNTYDPMALYPQMYFEPTISFSKLWTAVGDAVTAGSKAANNTGISVDTEFKLVKSALTNVHSAMRCGIAGETIKGLKRWAGGKTVSSRRLPDLFQYRLQQRVLKC